MSERGKAPVIFSPDRQSIFDDDFYHNLTLSDMGSTSSRILAPLTPRLALLYALPQRYAVEPRLFTLVSNAEQA